MQDLKQGISYSYLIELRKLTTQKRENNRKDNRVSHSRRDAGLTRAEHATRTRGEGKEETGAESKEESGGHEEIGLGEHETHRTRDEAVHEEEHKGVEEDSHLIGLAVAESKLSPVGGQENTWAEREKKGGRDGDFLGGDIGEHLIYVDIIFSKVNKVIKCGTSHHLFVKMVIIDHTSQTFPYIM